MQNSGHSIFHSSPQLTVENSNGNSRAANFVRVYSSTFSMLLFVGLASYALLFGMNSLVIGAVVLFALLIPNMLFISYLKKRDAGFISRKNALKIYFSFAKLQKSLNKQKQMQYYKHLRNTMKSYNNDQEIRETYASLKEELELHESANRKANRAIVAVALCLVATTITVIMTNFLAMFVGALLFLLIYAACIAFVYNTLKDKHDTEELKTEVSALKRVLEIEDATLAALKAA